jgi:hypothetical protein
MAGGLLIAAVGIALLARVQAHSSFVALLPGLRCGGSGSGC